MLYGCLIPCLYSAYTDAKDRRLYNYITFPVFLAGLAYSIWAGTWTNTFLATAVAIVIMYFMVQMGGMAGGDLKLAAALAMWFGYPGIIYIVTLGAVLGFVWGAYKLSRNGVFKERMGNMVMQYKLKFLYKVDVALIPVLPEDDVISDDTVPFGTFLILAAWIIYFLT